MGDGRGGCGAVLVSSSLADGVPTRVSWHSSVIPREGMRGCCTLFMHAEICSYVTLWGGGVWLKQAHTTDGDDHERKWPERNIRNGNRAWVEPETATYGLLLCQFRAKHAYLHCTKLNWTSAVLYSRTVNSLFYTTSKSIDLYVFMLTIKPCIFPWAILALRWLYMPTSEI